MSEISPSSPAVVFESVPRDLYLHLILVERNLFLFVIWIIDYFIFFFFLLSLVKSLLLNLRNLCSRSQQGNENIEKYRALETRSVY